MAMILDKDMKIAMRFSGYAQKYVVCPNGHQYIFTPNHNISIAFVDPDDMPYILNHKVGCCGNAKKAFTIATQDEYDKWVS